MEEENQVFGNNAEAVDKNQNLESEDFYFYNKNKEEAKKNIDNSIADLSDFIDSLIQDIPDPSEEEVNAGIEKILARTHPEEISDKTCKGNGRKKVTIKVLFIAALLSILAFSGLYVVGSNHNISIENGFVTFAKDTIKIVFFGEEKEECITIDALLTDLELHGYGDILFPQEFVTKSDEYKVSLPEYLEDVVNQVFFTVYNEESSYSFAINRFQSPEARDFLELENAMTIFYNNIYFYIFEHKSNDISAVFFKDEYWYSIKATSSYSKIEQIIKTVK